VLFSDLVGSTDWPGWVRPRSLSSAGGILGSPRAAVGEHDDREIKTTGNRILAVFASAEAALRCAVCHVAISAGQ
jgi:class 3 adenylate cyclase